MKNIGKFLIRDKALRSFSDSLFDFACDRDIPIPETAHLAQKTIQISGGFCFSYHSSAQSEKQSAKLGVSFLIISGNKIGRKVKTDLLK